MTNSILPETEGKISTKKKTISVNKISEEQYTINFADTSVMTILGTAHISQSSADTAQEIITRLEPDCICIEMDEKRLKNIENHNKFQDLDIISIIKKKQGFFFIGHLLLASMQKKLSDQNNTVAGDEFRKAVNLAREKNIRLETVDRDLGITLQRAWRLTPLKRKFAILGSLFSTEKISIDSETIEQMKRSDVVTNLMQELSGTMPGIKTVLVDERDRYLAENILEKKGKNTVVVIGAGHLQGVINIFKDHSENQPDLKKLEIIPPVTFVFKTIPWIIPAFIIGLFIYGFYRGNWDELLNATIYWIIVNGGLSALGCIIARAHPVAVLAGFIAAPFTSLNPFIGAGMVSGAVQAWKLPPRVIDFVNIQEDASSIRGWRKNRITRALAVLLLSSLGSSIGTFAALPYVLRMLR